MQVVVGQYLWETDSILRCKGTFTSNEGKRLMLQGVGTLFEFKAVQEPHSGFAFLFVGRGIDKAKLESDIKSCLI